MALVDSHNSHCQFAEYYPYYTGEPESCIVEVGDCSDIGDTHLEVKEDIAPEDHKHQLRNDLIKNFANEVSYLLFANPKKLLQMANKWSAQELQTSVSEGIMATTMVATSTFICPPLFLIAAPFALKTVTGRPRSYLRSLSIETTC